MEVSNNEVQCKPSTVTRRLKIAIRITMEYFTSGERFDNCTLRLIVRNLNEIELTGHAKRNTKFLSNVTEINRSTRYAFGCFGLEVHNYEFRVFRVNRRVNRVVGRKFRAASIVVPRHRPSNRLTVIGQRRARTRSRIREDDDPCARAFVNLHYCFDFARVTLLLLLLSSESR